jgi:hypothetical protein
MDMTFKRDFLDRWHKYFPGAELPIVFYFADDPGNAARSQKSDQWRCVICDLGRVRKGQALAFDKEGIACGGGQRYFGMTQELMPNFKYFLSCGIPGEMQGERYKKTPELVEEAMKSQPSFMAPGKYIVFKRWDLLAEADIPAGVIFFTYGDALSGLFTLANYDLATPYGVIAPFCSGCSSIVYYPYMELHAPQPRAVLGMFDVSARPYVPPAVVTFAVPWPKFVAMAGNMDESFLITESWTKVRARLAARQV